MSVTRRPGGTPAARPRRSAALPLAVAGLLVAPLLPPDPAHAAPAHAVATHAVVGPVAGQPTIAGQPAAGHEAHAQLAPLQAEQAWEHSTGDGVLVAVLDSGVDAGHPDLADRVLRGRDYVDGSTDGRVDPVGHGTTVASLVAGGGDPATGLAPDATILPVRVLDEQNRYEDASTVADGVRWAVDHGARVINLSLGGRHASTALREALAYAMARDVVVVACNGNATGDYRRVWYPAREPGVIAVSGLVFSGDAPARWPESLTGAETVLAAPAVVTGAQAGGGYRRVQGTSFSAALVAATAALIRAQWPDLPAGEVVNRLVATAEDLGTPGRNPIFGFGAVDPVGALTERVPRVHTNPLDTKARQRATGLGPAPAAGTTAADRLPPASAPGRAPGQPAGTAAREPAGGRQGPPAGPLAALLLTLSTVTGLVAAVTVAAVVRRHRRP